MDYMNLDDLKAQYYFFEPKSYGRVFIIIDFGNVRPWADDLWANEYNLGYHCEISIDKLSEVCSWVNPQRKMFYYGHFRQNDVLPSEHPDNIKSRASVFRIDRARKAGFLVKTKEIKMIAHFDELGKFMGKIPKCNFDVEITMDILTKIPTYDTVMLFSGDSDFAGLLSYVKSKGKKIVIVCTRARMSSELHKVADTFIPAETLAPFLKYEKNTPPRKG